MPSCHRCAICTLSASVASFWEKKNEKDDYLQWRDLERLRVYYAKTFFPSLLFMSLFRYHTHTHTYQFDRCTKIHPALPPSPPAPPSFWTRVSQCPRPLSPLSLSDCSWQGCTASSSRCTAETEPRVTHTKKNPPDNSFLNDSICKWNLPPHLTEAQRSLLLYSGFHLQV